MASIHKQPITVKLASQSFGQGNPFLASQPGRKTLFPGLYLPVYTRGIGTSLGVTGCIREYAGIPEYVLYTSRIRLQNGTSLGIYGRIQSRKQGFSSSEKTGKRQKEREKEGSREGV